MDLYEDQELLRRLGERYMPSAIQQGREALLSGEVPVGAVLVAPLSTARQLEGWSDVRPGGEATDGDEDAFVVVATGFNDTTVSCSSSRHAEMVAAEQFASRWRKSTGEHAPVAPWALLSQQGGGADASTTSTFRFEDSSLQDALSHLLCVVTVEPCIMCAAALSELGIRNVVFGASNERFGGCGSVWNIAEEPPAAGGGVPARVNSLGYLGLRCIAGVQRQAAIDLLQDFYVQDNSRAPEEKRASKSKRREAKRARSSENE